MEALYRKNQIPWINSTNYSVERIATKILDIMGLNRQSTRELSALAYFFVIMLTTRRGVTHLALEISSDWFNIVMPSTSRSLPVEATNF